jgi:hypothetical protein
MTKLHVPTRRRPNDRAAGLRRAWTHDGKSDALKTFEWTGRA